MDTRVVISFLIVLVGTCWCCSNGRVITTSQSSIQDAIASELQINGQQYVMDDELCTFCKVNLAPLIKFLSNTTSEEDAMSVLHFFCLFSIFFKDKCKAVVDKYVPLFFSEASSLTPKELCIKMALCHNTSKLLSENSCESCHHSVTEASLQLNHPYSQLHIVELLLKACNAMEDSANNFCKRLVLDNAILIPVHAKQMLNGHAICNLLHDCSSHTSAAEQASSAETYLDSAY